MMRPRTARFLGYAVVACLPLALAAQQAPVAAAPSPEDAAPTLRVTTRTVEIATVVRDKAGEPQNALTKEDFTLKVDGREQPIQHFTVASDLPLTLALLVDVSGSQRTFISDEWRASDIFFQSMLTRPQDRATLVQINARIRILANLTSDPGRLHLALTQLGASPSTANATRLNDAVYLLAKDLLAKERGRKALVLLTDGGDNGSKFKLEQAIEQAQRANISVYAIDYSAWTGPDMMLNSAVSRFSFPQNDPGEALLKKLAESTGGHVYTVSHSMSLQRIYEQIATDLRTEYEVGYNPPPDLKPNSFHKLEIRVRDKRLSVQARNGFYVQP
ncbi:VWA domain-containing protein [Terriglobus sp.]|uniref:VWA domain-containing protein n=1 Tax=Terriglobus sp. TaxID=1889013 RepID=UPI003B00E614